MSQQSPSISSQSSSSSSSSPYKNSMKQKLRKFDPKNAVINGVQCLFPIIRWLPKYNLRNNLHCDLVAGLTIGVMVVPQAMAYTTLVGVPPAIGLYTCFFGAFFYLFLGTSIHVSIGTFAVASMMVGNVLVQLHLVENGSPPTANHTNNGTIGPIATNLPTNDPLLVINSLTLFAGCFQLLMALCRLSFLTVYISDPLVSGFTTAAAVHVLVAQLDKLIGVHIKHYGGPGMVLFMVRDLFKAVPHANLWTLGISACGVAFLNIGRDFVNPFFRKRFHVPLPLELIMVVISVVFSLVFKIEEGHGVKIIKHVPNGMPLPSVPRLDLFPHLWSSALSLALICYVFVISLEKIFAKRHGYPVKANQELYALGLTNALTSLFPAYPFGASLSRSSLCEMLGAKTQLHALFSSSILLVVILWIGPLLEPLPIAILACIVVVSLKPLFLQYRDVPKLWRVSIYDMLIWLVAFTSTVLLDITYGLLVSVAFSIVTVMLREQWPKFHRVNPAKSDGGLAELQKSLHPHGPIEIWHFASPLHFANSPKFLEMCRKIVNKMKVEHHSNLPSKIGIQNDKENGQPITKEEMQYSNSNGTMVVECSAISHIDTVGCGALVEAYNDAKRQKVRLIYANFNEFMLKIFNRCGLIGQQQIPEENFYPIFPKSSSAGDIAA